MKLRATDTLHISSVGPEPIVRGQEFKVEKEAGKSLVARGLATEVEEDPEPEEKAEPAPANKAEPAPTNKAKPATVSKKGSK